MSFDKYQKAVSSNFKYHEMLTPEEARLLDWVVGLGGETGEVLELIKHHVFHKEPLNKPKVAKEIGDVLWYVAALCTSLGIDMQTCAELNVAKLIHRHGDTGYSRDGSSLRADREMKFEETEEYQELMRRLAL